MEAEKAKIKEEENNKLIAAEKAKEKIVEAEKKVQPKDMDDDIYMTEESPMLQQLNPADKDRVITLPGSQAPRNHIIANAGGKKTIMIKEPNWRSFYFWKIPWQCVYVLLLSVVYYYFVKLGGNKGYVPPGSHPTPAPDAK